MHCYKRGSDNYVKSDIIRNKQRYKCNDYNYKFTNTHGRGYPPSMKAEAMQLSSENMGIRSIARYFNCSGFVKWAIDVYKVPKKKFRHQQAT